jgi:hypothetical protein
MLEQLFFSDGISRGPEQKAGAKRGGYGKVEVPNGEGDLAGFIALVTEDSIGSEILPWGRIGRNQEIHPERLVVQR